MNHQPYERFRPRTTNHVNRNPHITPRQYRARAELKASARHVSEALRTAPEYHDVAATLERAVAAARVAFDELREREPKE